MCTSIAIKGLADLVSTAVPQLTYFFVWAMYVQKDFFPVKNYFLGGKGLVSPYLGMEVVKEHSH